MITNRNLLFFFFSLGIFLEWGKESFHSLFVENFDENDSFKSGTKHFGPERFHDLVSFYLNVNIWNKGELP